ncbi:MAG: hypothetical protein FWH43_08555, partial [Endomicrobia bacterium]|nr:hypothetical protein [Endomicrobiia bacterium]
MKKALSLLFAVVVYCSFAAMPVLAGESIFYDGSDTGMLQTIDGSANSLAPSGSSTGKSNSLSGNSITVSSNVSGRVYGAINTKDLEIVTGNSVVINTGTVGSYVYGGYSSSGSVTNNSITVNGGVNSIMYAGYSDGDSNSTGNILTINNGTVSFIIAGRAYNGNAIGNMVIINGDTVANDYVLGGYSNGSGNATGNSVIINSGTVSNYYYIAGGYIDLGATGNATENSVAINGGTINSNVAGGMAYTGSATNNIVTISGNPVFGASIGIYGGARSSGSGDIFTGNTLNVYNYKGSSFGRVQNFEYYNFVFPVDQSGPVLSVSTATLGDGAGKSSVVTAGTLDGKNRLTVGATRILIEADYLDDTDFTQAQAEGMHGAFFRYLWELDTAFNRLTAKLLSVDIIAQTKILSEGAAAGAILAGQGADNINGGLLSGLQEGKAEVIASIFGGSSKYDTGSSVEMNVFGIAAGIAKKFTSTSAGIFAEYADASFDTEYNGSTGDGKATATGIGVLVKKDMQEGAYVEGLIRAGQLSNDYKTKIDDGLGTTAD